MTLLPGTQLHGATVVAEGATIGPDTTLTDTEVGAGATVTRTHGNLAVLGAGTSVGPFAYLRPGTVLVSSTNFGPYYTEEGGRFPGEVGPIYVEGATTKDMLVVRIRQVKPNHSIAASQIYAAFGGLQTEESVRLLNEPLKPRRYVWQLDHERNTATTTLPDSRMRTVTVDMQPMLGRVAVAPRGPRVLRGSCDPAPVPRRCAR